MDIWVFCFLILPIIVILYSIFVPIYDYIKRKRIIKSFHIGQTFQSISYLDKYNPFYNTKIITVYTIEDMKYNCENELWIKYSTKANANGRDNLNKDMHFTNAWDFSNIIKDFKS